MLLAMSAVRLDSTSFDFVCSIYLSPVTHFRHQETQMLAGEAQVQSMPHRKYRLRLLPPGQDGPSSKEAKGR